MLRILLVKTSSLGDVVHNFPVATDIRRHFPDARIDWAVEEGLAELPSLHPAVSTVIPVATRRWRRSLIRRQTREEIAGLRLQLQTRGYDFVVDTQGLLKSALICLLAPGRRCGLDWRSSREPLRALYHRTFAVPWSQHAVERNRSLAGQALGYALDTPAGYELRAPGADAAPAWADDWAQEPWAVLLHATSAANKLWPEPSWVKLGDELHRRGLRLLLPWGNAHEEERSRRIAGLLPHAFVPPRASLREAAWMLGDARLVVGVDTGLTHLAAALGTPTLGLYGATDPAATGIHAARRALNLGAPGRFPAAAEAIAAARELLA